jgi:hypothetical protein
MVKRVPTSALAAAGLIAGFGVAVATGSRPLGGVIILLFGLPCIYVWLARDDRATALKLTGAGLFAFALSHVLGLIIHPWPSVFVVSAATAAVCWRLSDRKWLGRRTAAAVGGQPAERGTLSV